MFNKKIWTIFIKQYQENTIQIPETKITAWLFSNEKKRKKKNMFLWGIIDQKDKNHN